MADNSPVDNTDNLETGPNPGEEPEDGQLYAGKFEDDSALEQGYLELEKRLGERNEFEKLGRALHDHGVTGEDSISGMEDYLSNRDEYNKWLEERQQTGTETPSVPDAKQFWEQAANNPHDVIGKLVEERLQQAMGNQMAQTQQQLAQQQEELVWQKMRQQHQGFTDHEEKFREWVSTTPATPENLWTLYQAKLQAENATTQLNELRAQQRDLAGTFSGEPMAPREPNVKLEAHKGRDFEAIKRNAQRRIQAGEKFSV